MAPVSWNDLMTSSFVTIRAIFEVSRRPGLQSLPAMAASREPSLTGNRCTSWKTTARTGPTFTTGKQTGSIKT